MTGTPDDYIEREGDEMTLRDGYRLRRWIVQCIPCMENHLEHGECWRS